MALTARLALTLYAALTSPLDLSTPLDELSYSHRIDLSSGTGANQGDMAWHDKRTLAASATENLDLAGVLTNAFGATQTFARVKALAVFADPLNTNDVQVTRPATNGLPLFLAAGDGLPVKPGGAFWWVAPGAPGVAVTPGTGDLVTVTNSAAGTAVTYDIVVIGASA